MLPSVNIHRSDYRKPVPGEGIDKAPRLFAGKGFTDDGIGGRPVGPRRVSSRFDFFARKVKREDLRNCQICNLLETSAVEGIDVRQVADAGVDS